MKLNDLLLKKGIRPSKVFVAVRNTARHVLVLLLCGPCLSAGSTPVPRTWTRGVAVDLQYREEGLAKHI